ncbi:MAG: chemotaxis protein CheC, partial [Firmicutes bacterium]|nr:chemotaxis protein CheC [Bacillota bacterium]
HAGNALAQFTQLSIKIRELSSEQIPWPQLSYALHIKNPAEDALYLVQLDAIGLFQAQVWLLLDESAAQILVTALLGEPSPQPLDDIGRSALGEIGNILGTAFLNVFADAFQQRWEPSPPHISYGILWDLMTTQLPNVDPTTAILVSQALFSIDNQPTNGYLVVVPIGTSPSSTVSQHKGEQVK